MYAMDIWAGRLWKIWDIPATAWYANAMWGPG